MAPKTKDLALKELQQIPSIGPKVGEMLIEIGVLKIDDLKGGNPETLYQQICAVRNETLDRCVLYHFRCAVYFASNENPDPDLLKWWCWKEN